MNVDRKHSSATIKNLVESISCAGFSLFANKAISSLTDEGIKLTLEQFQKGYGYKVDKILSSNDIEECLKLSEVKRGPSANRFRCLVKYSGKDTFNNEQRFMMGDYYRVTSRSFSNTTDIVFINNFGNIACTSSSYARWGMPSKHIFAVMYNGNLCVNMKNHYHPVYHLQFMTDIDSIQFNAGADLTTVPQIIPNTSACWNWAQQASKENWDMIGLGGPTFTAMAYPTARSISQAAESTAESTKKALNFLAPYINNSLAEREFFYIYYEGLLKRY